MHGASLLILAVAVLAGACSRNQSQMRGGSYDNGPPDTLVIKEVLRIGDEAAGDTVFFTYIEDLAANSRGQIYVMEPMPASVRAFESDGSYLSNIGAVGEGPGEFTSSVFLGDMFIGPADSVYVFEGFMSMRLHIFDPVTFEFVRELSIPEYPVSESERVENTAILGVIESGFLFQLRLVPSRMTATAYRETANVIRLVNRDGSYGPVVTTGQGSEGVVALREVRHLDVKVPLPDGIPFARSMKSGLGPNATLFAGWNETVDIAMLSTSGIEEGRITMNHDPVPVTQAEMDLHMSYYGPEMRNAFRERGLHTTKPAYNELLVDDENRLWLESSITADSNSINWIVMDMDSRVMGIASFPMHTDIKAVRHGHVYAAGRKAGVPMVVVYEYDL